MTPRRLDILPTTPKTPEAPTTMTTENQTAAAPGEFEKPTTNVTTAKMPESEPPPERPSYSAVAADLLEKLEGIAAASVADGMVEIRALASDADAEIATTARGLLQTLERIAALDAEVFAFETKLRRLVDARNGGAT